MLKHQLVHADARAASVCLKLAADTTAVWSRGLTLAQDGALGKQPCDRSVFGWLYPTGEGSMTPGSLPQRRRALTAFPLFDKSCNGRPLLGLTTTAALLSTAQCPADGAPPPTCPQSLLAHDPKARGARDPALGPQRTKPGVLTVCNRPGRWCCRGYYWRPIDGEGRWLCRSLSCRSPGSNRDAREGGGF